VRCPHHSAALCAWNGSTSVRALASEPCWGEPSYAVVDCETTIGDPTVARLIEVAVVLCDRDAVVQSRWSSLVDPQQMFPPSVHGLSLADVQGAPLAAAVIRKVVSLITGRVVVGHNVAFDLSVLRSEAGSAGVPLTYEGSLCTFENLPAIGITSNRSLAAVSERLALPTRPTHRALPDAEATAELLRHLLERARFDGYSLLVPSLCRPLRSP
jgi:DNA polymerase III epsilon subunit-like protein